ncbi:MAG: heparinase II/III family protein [Pyrinomonadaceae bacterium MAG19_C2-C3]|nr:heparinase II/III family protein [Pyrinomonadaceae bacterium MAG19_C2-C3]
MSIIGKIKKLHGRSFDELRVRGGQVVAAQLERRGMSNDARLVNDKKFAALFDRDKLNADSPPITNFKSNKGNETSGSEAAKFDELLLTSFRAARAPRFFAGFDNVPACVEEHSRRFAASRAKVIETARRNVNNRFDLLGYKDLSFGAPIDWHLEPIANKRTPLVHWSLIDYLNAEAAGDKKITWELNRHQHFVTLGRAYLLTNDESFAQAFVNQLNSWMDANPPKLGINWASSLEVAFRLISWLWAFHFFKDSPSLDRQTFSRATKFLYIHARHLETYLSTYFSPNTHLTGEALGLFYTGTLLPEFRRARVWRATGERILCDEINRHVRADGVYFEQSSFYHRYTTDFYTHYVLLKRANGEVVDDKVKDRLRLLFEHLTAITQPDGRTPFYGDDDGGRLVKLDGCELNDFRAALINGAIIFGREDFKFVAGDAGEENLWLHGTSGLRVYDKLAASEPQTTSQAFGESGYFVMRDGWQTDSNYMLLDCGAHGTANCAHAHADALSFVLSANGKAALIDAGTYTYTGSKAERDWFRSTRAHNTLTIDDESSSIPERAFQWSYIADAKAEKWISKGRFDFFAGRQDGFTRLEHPAMQRREVLFLKNDYFILRDTVESSGAHLIRSHLHFTPHAEIEIERKSESPNDGDALSGLTLKLAGEAGLRVISCGDERGAWRVEDGFVAPCYGAKQAGRAAYYEAISKADYELMTLLLPLSSSEDSRSSNFEISKLVARNGTGCEIKTAANCDYVIFGDAGKIVTVDKVKGSRLEVEGEWAWLRFEAEGLSEVILINGKRMRYGEYEIVGENEGNDFIFAWRAASGEWHVEASGKANVNVSVSVTAGSEN